MGVMRTLYTRSIPWKFCFCENHNHNAFLIDERFTLESFQLKGILWCARDDLSHVCMFTGGSLDKYGAIPEPVLGRIVVGVSVLGE